MQKPCSSYCAAGLLQLLQRLPNTCFHVNIRYYSIDNFGSFLGQSKKKIPQSIAVQWIAGFYRVVVTLNQVRPPIHQDNQCVRDLHHTALHNRLFQRLYPAPYK